MPPPILSILTPAIPERMAKLSRIVAAVEAQRKGRESAVEHIVLLDSRSSSTIGEKRDSLLRLARGDYVAFADDDDLIYTEYVARILAAIAAYRADTSGHSPDVVTFRQAVTYCGHSGEVEFGLGNHNEPFAPGRTTKRAPWHVCAFRRPLALAHHFPPTNYGEDWAWARHVAADCQTSIHIDAVLHHYIHDPEATAAPAPLT